MCRLLGIVSSEPTDFRLVLREAPRSLAALSEKHPDGWGLAVYGDDPTAPPSWSLRKGTLCALKDDDFHKTAAEMRGVLLLSHVRQKTVGPTSLENTHPFASDGWLFAHNGTITDVEFVKSKISPARAERIEGDTDSERFFAWILTTLDRAGLTSERVHDASLDGVIKEIVSEARGREAFGAFNFLLSNGRVTFAHRFGRTLFVLRRGPHDQVRRERTGDDGVTIVTPWSQRRHAIIVASERMTDEPWEELPEGSLLRIDRKPTPRMMAL